MTRTARQLLRLMEPYSEGQEPILIVLRVAEIRDIIGVFMEFEDKLNLALASSSVFFATVNILFEQQKEGMYHRREEYPLVLGSRPALIFAAYRNAAKHLILRNEYYPTRLDISRMMKTYPWLKKIQFESAERLGTTFTVTVRPNTGLPLLDIKWHDLSDTKYMERLGDWTIGLVNNPKYRLATIEGPLKEEWQSIEKAFEREGTQKALELVTSFRADIPARVLREILPMPSLGELDFRVEDHRINPTALFQKLALQPRLKLLKTNTHFDLTMDALKTSGLRAKDFTCSADDKWAPKQNVSHAADGLQMKWDYRQVLGTTIDAAWDHRRPVECLYIYSDYLPELDVGQLALLIRSRAPWCEILYVMNDQLHPEFKENNCEDTNVILRKENYRSKASLINAGFGPYLEGEL